MTPIIGILGAIDENAISSIMHTYVGALERAGALPLLLPYLENKTRIGTFVELCDGFLIAGGMDVDPRRYGEEKGAQCGELQSYRDEMEFEAMPLMLASGKPVLGICRGAQVINVAFGGSLYQDIPGEYETDIAHRQTEGDFEFSHAVNVENSTPLWHLWKKERVVANSFHHQAVKRLGEGLSVMARADDGIVEAFYAPEHPYLRAYQWHPERLVDKDECSRAIFADFVAACEKK